MIFGLYLLIMNIYGFIVIRSDKKKSLSNKWRIPEKRFFSIAVFGGALGIYFGMKNYRHKTKTAIFKYGIPLVIFMNIITVYFILEMILKIKR